MLAIMLLHNTINRVFGWLVVAVVWRFTIVVIVVVELLSEKCLRKSSAPKNYSAFCQRDTNETLISIYHNSRLPTQQSQEERRLLKPREGKEKQSKRVVSSEIAHASVELYRCASRKALVSPQICATWTVLSEGFPTDVLHSTTTPHFYTPSHHFLVYNLHSVSSSPPISYSFTTTQWSTHLNSSASSPPPSWRSPRRLPFPLPNPHPSGASSKHQDTTHHGRFTCQCHHPHQLPSP